MLDRLWRDPGRLALAIALVATAAIYAPTIGRGIVSYDDPWLVRDNWIVAHPSWSSLRAIAFDLDPDTRFALGAEYLPVRDVSVMFDHALWGSWYGGFHLTNLAIYLAAIAAWFSALTQFGIDRRIAGVTALLWALHPTHAESVAWLAERKGLLGALCAGVAAWGYARFRVGDSLRWLALATCAAVCAVWSKAPAAFAIAALAGLELALPARRRSLRRSAVGLCVIAGASLAAFAPVVAVALRASIVGGDSDAPAGYLAMAVGGHGFYLELAGMALPNAASYPIATSGPTGVDLALGAVGLTAIAAVVFAPRSGRFAPSGALRAAAILWLACWFPISRLVLPLHAVLVADRYLLFPTLGVALALASGLMRIANPRVRAIAIAAVAAAAAARSLAAQESWQDSAALWQRAVESNPADGAAWSMYAEALADAGQREAAARAVDEGLRNSGAPRLLLRKALLVLDSGERAGGLRLMREAADAGEPRAMSNLALLLLDDHQLDEARAWASRGAAAQPMYAPGHRTHGKVALAAQAFDEAHAAFRRAYALEPANLTNRYNLGIVLAKLGWRDEARPQFAACLGDPRLAPLAQRALAELGW